MGYLSCSTQSSVSVSNPHSNSPSSTEGQQHYYRKTTDESPINIEEFEYKDLQLATSNFSEQKLLGRGSHGLVYKAVLRSGRLVAVKKPSRRRPSTSNSLVEFENEFDILSNLHSPRFVNLLGYTISESKPNSSSSFCERLLVVEFMSNGTLYELLHKNPKPPNWGRRIRIALQTAKAVETLHSQFPPVIHRDIKSANILIDTNHDARLGDFGLALKFFMDEYHKLPSTPPAGTMGYLDPLYVTPENLSTKADVFSFGILLLEIISGRKAIDVVHSPPSIIDWAIPLIRKDKQLLLTIFDPRIPLPKDEVVSRQLAVIAAKCVRSCRERRPSMKEVVKALDGLSKLVPLKKKKMMNSWALPSSTNPCMVVVDSVVNPVELASVVHHSVGSRRFIRGFECGNPNDVVLKSSKRVYSDLGFRNNLKDLMDKPDDGEEQTNSNNKSRSLLTRGGSSFRIISDRFVARGRGGALAQTQLRRNQSSHLQ